MPLIIRQTVPCHHDRQWRLRSVDKLRRAIHRGLSRTPLEIRVKTRKNTPGKLIGERAMSFKRLIASFGFACAALPVLLLFAVPAAGATTPEQEDVARIAELVLANHIIADQGVVDGFGHISVRSVKNPNHYFIARSRAPALVTADDIMEYDLDDHPIDARGRSSYLERFIHSEIYKARPDVQSVIHSHSPGVIPFGVSDVPLRPISHMGGFLIRQVPVFEIREAGGNETDMLIRNKALGAALAAKLGNGTVVLMRGHGDTVVGQSIKTAVFHAIYTELNARLEAEALRLGGKVTYLNEIEAAKIGEQNDKLVDRPWEIWQNQAIAHSQQR
jgi:ribulose-5-phosphate 4-epimerase/fuculose-1-phosphate aldolase